MVMRFILFFVVSILGHFERVVSALGCFLPESFWPGRFGPGSFRPILAGRFGLIIFKFLSVRVTGRTLRGRIIIWLFDEESTDIMGLF